MAHGLLSVAPRIESGLVCAPAAPPGEVPAGFEWIHGSHPLPDARSERAGRRALALAASTPPDGVLLVLLSGGASSLLAVPAAGVTLADKAAAASALMSAGAPIADLNCVRRHLSAIKGGWLGAAAGWRVRTLAISDVHAPVEDDPSAIGSGPTVPDPTTFADALHVVRKYGARVPHAVWRHLETGVRGKHRDTPKPAEVPPLEFYTVIGSRRTAMEGAAAAARALGYEVEIVDPPSDGEARVAGRAFAERAFAARAGRTAAPVCVVASGETVVTVSGDGRGGRNQEFVLGAVPALDAVGAEGRPAALGSAGTDGIDGPTDAAGAIADVTTARRARRQGIDLVRALARNDAYPALAALGSLLMWGPTGTNVGDLHVMILGPPEAESG